MDNISYSDLKISRKLTENINILDSIFNNESNIRIRYFKPEFCGRCALIFIDGMVNNSFISEAVIKPMLLTKNGENSINFITEKVLFASEVTVSNKITEIISAVTYGDSVILIDGFNDCIIADTKGFKTRGITEPKNEQVLEGPREGFEESVMLNSAMLRRKLPTADLKTEFLTVGKKTETKMFLCYLESVADKSLVKEIKSKLSKIKIDGILDSNYIAENICENRFSLFKTIGKTERPDVVAAKLLEGRIALLVDGTPTALTLPYLFSESFQADDDYYLNFLYSSIGRILRYISFFLTTTVPAIYIALSVFHPYLLPTSLITTICAARSRVPFPTFVECLLLSFVFEILREAGIRMPQNFSHALSVVGGLVIGQAAVEAKIVSAPMLIVVALSGICGLMVPKLKTAAFYIRLMLIVLSSAFGLIGCFFGVLIVLISIFNLSSFGVDYTSALSEISGQSLKDSIFRLPWWYMISRPKALTNNKIRQRNKK